MPTIATPLKDMVSSLIATPSVSSTQSEFDLSNNEVINLLANWLDPLGFDIQITPIKDKPGKSNLIAGLAAELTAYCSQDTPTPFLMTIICGSQPPSK